MIPINYHKEEQEYEIRKITCQMDNSIEEIYYSQIGNITIIRDDQLCAGSKSRFVFDMIKAYPQYDEYLYMATWYGGAQVALTWGIHKYNEMNDTNKKAVMFCEEPGYEYPFIKLARSHGAIYHYSDEPYLAVLEYLQNHNAMLVPSGFDLAVVRNKINELGKLVKEQLGEFDDFYYACGSGTLVRGIQNSGLAKKYHAIAVTDLHHMPDVGSKRLVHAQFHDQPFDEIVLDKYQPPFTSAIHYDAKAWRYANDPANKNKRIIFWNVF